MKILIAEDDFVSRTLLQEMMNIYGTSHVASNGKEALDAFADMLDSDKPYELICLDIMMPVMDGQEALKEIRELEHKKGIGGSDAVKIIMTTALDDPQNIMQALIKGGCDGYLTKPINPDEMNKILAKMGIEPMK